MSDKLSDGMRIAAKNWDARGPWNVPGVVERWAGEVEQLEQRAAEGDRLLLAAALKYKGVEQRVEGLEDRLDYAEDVLGNVGMDDTLDYLEETWPLAQEEA